MKILTLSFLLFTVYGTFVWAQKEAPTYPPSLNYWTLSFEILTNEQLEELLAISPRQRLDLNDMRAKPEIAKLLEDTSAKLLVDLGIPPSKGDLPFEVYTQCDELIAIQLKKILEPQQFALLRKAALAVRFQQPQQCLSDAEILEFCGVSISDRSSLEDRIKRGINDYDTHIRKLRDRATHNVCQKLPPHAREKFVQYAGNKYSPEFTADPKLDYRLLPISSLRTRGTIEFVLASAQSQKDLEITQHQLGLLSQAITTFGEDQELSQKLEKFEDIHRAYLQNYAKCMKSCFDVFTERQLLALSRIIAMQEFENNPGIPFERQGVIAFLELSALAAQEIRVIAHREIALCRAEIAKFKRKTFDDLVGNLAAPAKNRLSELLRDVWELQAK